MRVDGHLYASTTLPHRKKPWFPLNRRWGGGGGDIVAKMQTLD